MSLSRTAAAANKLDWAKVISSLKLTGKTATQLSTFKKRNDEARRQLFELEQQPVEVDFSHYRSVLNNSEVVDKIERYVKSYSPVTVDTSKQLGAIASFEKLALENAKETEEIVSKELKALKETLANIESARPFDQLTVDELVKAKPEIDERVAELVKNGKWEIPSYYQKFGNMSVM
ncbi:ATP7 [Nakaseomyces glabratus]|nr:ATP7 [Nakaseomyces glabratus]UCS28417.1 ATP7 [Nakaseomyces glabratus]UCS33646.1 ATP7 [Nakaseomyces glabratus]UCS38875.1 ATP7 [Nakaseomyces glabratus]